MGIAIMFFRNPLRKYPIGLAIDIAIRDLEARYRRSLAGLLWLVLTPLAMLGLYWMVFGVVFNVTWRHPFTNEKVGFVLPFFVGLAFYLFFTDTVVSSANLFVSKRNYVIKSSFPIWILWLANLVRAGAHGLINLIILLLLALNEQRLAFSGLIWMMAGVTSGLLFICALSLLLSCLGPFIGDMSEASQLVLRVLFYTSPVTYPLEIVPEGYRFLLWLNPLTHVIEPLRRAIVFGRGPELSSMMLFNAISILLLASALWIFRRTKGVIADVV